MTDASDDYVLNPSARLGLEEPGGAAPARVHVVALRRGRGWQQSVVRQDEQPRLFSLLRTLARANGAVDLEISDEDGAAMRDLGLWLPRDEAPGEVSFVVPLDGDDAAAPAAAGSAAAADGSAPAAGWLVHPRLAHRPPPAIELSRQALRPGPTIWIDDAPTGVTVPYWPGSLAAAVRACTPGHPAPHLDAAAGEALRRAGVLVAPGQVERRAAARARQLAAAAQGLAARGHALVPDLLPRAHLAALRRYYARLVDEGYVHFGDSQVERRYAMHNEPMARLFLTALTDVVAAVAGEPIKPAYAYFVSYREGAVLDDHRDRAQCQFSVSFLLDYEPVPEGPAPWPLFVHRAPDEPGVPLYQRVGDAIFYKGCELYHSRPRLPDGHRSTHVFFHYVPRDFAGSLD